MLYFNLTNFNGFATLYDLNKNVLNSNKYSKGVKSDYEYIVKTTKGKDNLLLSRIPENCESVTETKILRSCWFWIYNDGSTEIIDCYDEYEYITYENCESPEGGSGGGTTVVVEDKEIQIDDTELTGKAKCVYEKLKENSKKFIEAIKKFDGDFPVSHLKLVEEDLGSTRAVTRAPDGAGNSPDYTITIALNNNSTSQGVGYRPNLMSAKTIAHEIIHAEMYRKLLSFLDNGGNIAGVTRQDVLDKSKDFPGIYYYFKNYKNWQHEQMANHYRESIADVLESFDNNQHSRQFYMDLSWEGLDKTSIVGWQNGVSNNEKIRIRKVISDYIEANKNQTCQ